MNSEEMKEWWEARRQVRNQVGDQVWGQVGDQVWRQVGRQERDQVWSQMWEIADEQ